jgi:hypothetical protein
MCGVCGVWCVWCGVCVYARAAGLSVPKGLLALKRLFYAMNGPAEEGIFRIAGMLTASSPLISCPCFANRVIHPSSGDCVRVRVPYFSRLYLLQGRNRI